MRLVYSRSLTVGGVLIRTASWWDQWNHAGIVTPDNMVINARAFHGVVEEPLIEFAARYSKMEIVEVATPDDAAGLAFARSKIGCGYDYGALVRFISSRFGVDHSPERFECIELVEDALRAAGRDRFRREGHRISVAQSYMVK